MQSPFPGMDPYLEARWRGVHHRLCTYAADALQPQILPALRARIDERVVIDSIGGRPRETYPDVAVTEPWRVAEAGASVLSTEPLVILDDDPVEEGFIRIIEADNGDRLVTVIEFLSFSNKLPGEDQRKYLQKQNEYREAGVSLVEIDLLRRGQRLVTARGRIPPSHCTTYLACVWRASRGQYEVYPAPLRQALPTIRIPLREGDADAQLDLQSLIEQVYRNGAYDDIDYTQPPEPPFDPGDAAWAAELLKTAASRAR